MKHHETLVIRCDDIGARCGDVGDRAKVIRCDDIIISALDAEMSAIVGSYRRGGDIGDCGVGLTPQIIIIMQVWKKYSYLHD